MYRYIEYSDEKIKMNKCIDLYLGKTDKLISSLPEIRQTFKEI